MAGNPGFYLSPKRPTTLTSMGERAVTISIFKVSALTLRCFEQGLNPQTSCQETSALTTETSGPVPVNVLKQRSLWCDINSKMASMVLISQDIIIAIK